MSIFSGVNNPGVILNQFTPTETTFLANFSGLSVAQGDVYYVSSTGQVAVLAPGTNGYVLTTGGAGANPSWTNPSTGGTVTSVSVVTAQGVSGTVANATTTPAITLALGALTGVTSYNGLVVTANTGVITTGTWNGTAITGTYIASSVALGGSPTTTTQNVNDNSTKIATTAFVQSVEQMSMATVPLSITGGTYSFASIGSGVVITYTTTGGAISGITLIPVAGSNYKVGDLITVPSGNYDAVLQVATLTGSGVASLSILYGGTGYSNSGSAPTALSSSTPFTYTLTGVLGSDANFIMTPGTYLTQSNQWCINNNTTGAHNVTFQIGTNSDTATGTGVTIPQGTNSSKATLIQTDGVSDVWFANPAGTGTVTAVSIATANGFSGSSSGGATPALTIVAGSIVPNTVVASDATTPHIDITAGSTNTGYFLVNGKTSGSLKITTADATAQAVTLTVSAQTVGSATLTIPNMANTNKTVAWLESPSFTTPSLGVASATTINKVTLTAPATGSTLTISDGKTLSATDTTTIGTNSITFAGGEVVTFTATNALTFTTTAGTSVTLPTSGTLVNTAVASLSSLTTTGTITSGGLGTGATIGGVTMSLGSDAVGDIYAATTSNVLSRIAAVATGQVLISKGTTTLPAWSASPTVSNLLTTSNAITASGNAATVPVTSKINTVTNNSAATLTITMTTTNAIDGQLTIVRILDASGAAQTISWVNTEDSTVAAPTTSNGSTTLPLTVGFQYNNATSKWRTIAKA